MKFTFTVDGHPVGYYAQGKRPNWKRMKHYHAYKALVQASAQAAGIPLPLTATKDEPVMITTKAYFRNGVHCDPENVRKGISDALFYGSGGTGDKYCAGRFMYPLYDAENPRVEVEIFCGPACRVEMTV